MLAFGTRFIGRCIIFKIRYLLLTTTDTLTEVFPPPLSAASMVKSYLLVDDGMSIFITISPFVSIMNKSVEIGIKHILSMSWSRCGRNENV